jgi:RimJ/RimL family protein N-acetyltransferase
MNPVIRFGTARLQAEALRDGDLDDLIRLHQDPTVMATLGGVRTHDRTRQFLKTNLEHWDVYGFGLWIFRTVEGSFAGRAGLRHVRIGGADEVELAYTLRSEVWGRGLATEMARAILAIGFCQLQLSRVVAFTLKSNEPSKRVMEKVGCLFERELIHVGLPHLLYGQKLEQYLAP